MVESEAAEREFVLEALRGYLEELRETGVTELVYGERPAPVAAPVDEPAQTSQAPLRAGLAAGVELHRFEAGQAPAGSIAASVPAPDPGDINLAPATGSGPAACAAYGNPQARLLFVMSGEGFTGEAGELLANIIKGMKFSCEEVRLVTFALESFGAPAVTREELMGQIAAVNPEVVVALGDAAGQLLLETGKPVTALRGKFHVVGDWAVMPSLHPEKLLENQALKRDVWNDMKQVMARLAGNTG